MQIDWLTVAAQIVNFLVLAWLLKRFLYRPVVEAMARREERIASRLEQAELREKEAQAEAHTYREKVAQIDRDREAHLAQARDAAERERHELIEAARNEAQASRERWQQELDREQADFRAALVRELAEAAIDVARRTLADLADAQLEGQAIATLARRVRSMPEDEQQALAEAAPRLRLASTFEPEAKALEGLRKALGDTLGREVQLECVRKPELVLGVELLAAGHKLAWSVAANLDEIADRVRVSLAEAREATQEAKPESTRPGTRATPGGAAPEQEDAGDVADAERPAAS